MAGAGAGAGTGWEQRRWSLQGTYARVTGDVKGLGYFFSVVLLSLSFFVCVCVSLYTYICPKDSGTWQSYGCHIPYMLALRMKQSLTNACANGKHTHTHTHTHTHIYMF